MTILQSSIASNVISGATGATGPSGSNGTNGATGATGGTPWTISGANTYFTGGNVGVNNTSPGVLTNTTQVAVKANVNGDSMFVAQNSNGLTTAKFGFQYTGGIDQPVIGSYSNHPLVFLTNNAEAMRIRSDGNIGISCSGSANYKLMLNSTSPNQEVVCIQTLNTNTGTGLAGEGPLMLQNTNKTNNNMAAISNFDGNGNINTQINFVNTDHGGGGAIAFTTRTDGGASYGERMRINQNGDIAVGLVIPRAHFDVGQSGGSTGAPMSISRGGDAGILVNFFTTHNTTTSIGNIYAAGLTNTQYNTSSDYRLKENIIPMTSALAKVSLLKPCTYTWKVNGEDGQGFIAHELQEVFPDAVHGEKDAVDSDGNIVSQGIDTSYLVATLTAAIQEQQAMIEELKAEVAALKANNQ